jgi:hypothetical protein
MKLTIGTLRLKDNVKFLPERNLAKATSRDNESVDRDNNAVSNDTAVTMGNLFKSRLKEQQTIPRKMRQNNVATIIW